MQTHQSTIRRMSVLDQQIQKTLAALGDESELMSRMARYSLGLITTQGEQTDDETRLSVQGKRIRPQIAMMVTEAFGGTAEAAAPVSAAIELLHNFTLVHDDIQDRSPNRRHRPTVWRVWNDAQAINAGDALFAASQLSIIESAKLVSSETMLKLLEWFNRCTIEIVRGQVQDLQNEGASDVTPEVYLDTIRGKTAAILAYSAWAGAVIAGADLDVADRASEMGLSIGMGFQIRDDMLGIWGPPEETGKGEADDLRRRKQTLPVLILRNAASEEDAERINEIYGKETIDEDAIAELLALLEKYDVLAKTASHVEKEHEHAIELLENVFPDPNHPAVQELRTLITQLVNRSF